MALAPVFITRDGVTTVFYMSGCEVKTATMPAKEFREHMALVGELVFGIEEDGEG